MKTSSVSAILKITLSSLLVALAILFGDTFQRLMAMNYRAEYTVEVPIGSQMSNLGAFCLVSMLFLAASWGILSSVLPGFGEGALTRMKELRIVIVVALMILLIGMAIVGNYFAQRIDRWF